LPFCHVILRGQKPLSARYPTDPKTVGEHLLKKRLDRGLLQREVADVLGTTESNVWNWESNRNEPALRFIPRIVGFLGYDPFPMATSFGERLTRHRTLRGLSRVKFAVILGVDPSTVRQWETGRRLPMKRHKAALDAVCGIDLSGR
jgi:transcriptional regulator with XRE-family HTH domain